MAGCCGSRDYNRFFGRRVCPQRCQEVPQTRTRQHLAQDGGLPARARSRGRYRSRGRRRRRRDRARAPEGGGSRSTTWKLRAHTRTRRAGSRKKRVSQGASTGESTTSPKTRKAVELADIVVMHRVVCCYPDYERLLGAAADHARHALVFSDRRGSRPRAPFTGLSISRRLIRSGFRGFAHPPAATLTVLEERGLAQTYEHHGRMWQIAGHERAS